MKNTTIYSLDVPSRTTRILTLFLFGVISLFMFSLALRASAAPLTRQLELGSTGQDVSDLQVFLAKDAMIYPQGIVSGYFGFLTKSAVSNFQNANSIANVGRVGPITLSLINTQMNGDMISPVISPVSVSVSNTSATLSWNTDKNAAAVIYYSTAFPTMTEGNATSGANIGGSSLLVHTDLRTMHSGTGYIQNLFV